MIIDMKKLIKLTESDLHKIIKESVKKALNELDWKTYMNAYKNDKDPIRRKKFLKASVDRFNDDYKFRDDIDTGNFSHNRLKMDSIGRLTNYSEDELGNETTSTLSNDGSGAYCRGENYGARKNRMVSRNKKNARKTAKASDEFNHYFSGEAKYNKGKGWSKPQNKSDWHDYMYYNNDMK